MRILLSNDDGYFAPGLAALAEGLKPLGEITVVAPERDRSGASNSLTLDRPLMHRQALNGFHYVNGTPTDCVHMAVTGLLLLIFGFMTFTFTLVLHAAAFKARK